MRERPTADVRSLSGKRKLAAVSLDLEAPKSYFFRVPHVD